MILKYPRLVFLILLLSITKVLTNCGGSEVTQPEADLSQQTPPVLVANNHGYSVESNIVDETQSFQLPRTKEPRKHEFGVTIDPVNNPYTFESKSDEICWCLGGQCMCYGMIFYIPEYWGTYPCYSYGTIPTAIYLTYNGPYPNTSICVKTYSWAINLAGSNGVQNKDPQMFFLEIAKGETKLIDGSFTAFANAEALCRLIVKVYVGRRLCLKKEGVYALEPL